MAYMDRSLPLGAITLGRLGGAFTRGLSRLQSWNDTRRTRKALSALSDHELSDIGLCRGDLDSLG